MKEKIKGIVDNNLSVLVIYACLVAVIFAGIISKGSTYLSGYDNLTQTYAWLYKQWAGFSAGWRKFFYWRIADRTILSTQYYLFPCCAEFFAQ